MIAWQIVTDCQSPTQVGFGDVRYSVPLPPVAAGSSLPNMAASHAPVFEAPAGSNSRVAAVPLPGQLTICGNGVFAAHRLHACPRGLIARAGNSCVTYDPLCMMLTE